MPIPITMPRLSDTMERGTVVHWNVKEGDAVKPGMVLGDIETDKATMELQAFDTGTVAAILLSEGATIEVGRNILVLAEEGEDAAQIRAQFASAAASAPAVRSGQVGDSINAAAPTATALVEPQTQPVTNGHSVVAQSGAATGGGRIFASPLAKKIAGEKGIDLSRVHGTGPGGRITRRDVESGGIAAGAGAPSLEVRLPAKASRPTADLAAGNVSTPVAPAPLPSFGPGLKRETQALSNMRRTIAARLVQSKATIPHYQVTVAVNMDPLLSLRQQLNEQLASQGVKLSVNDFLVRACALAMHQHPYVNASWGADNASISLHDRVNIGVAISLPSERGGGLVVASLRDADRMGLRQISSETKTLAEKARTRGLTIDEMDGSTFTISNLGMFGVEHFTAIINPPNSAILAVGAAVEKPVARGGQIVVGHEMQMTMSSDHRVIDGAMAAAYLKTVKELLEAPATLLV
ncbi:MAG: 2-oxo acid dehydrogenase subunit E2 [Phycisphaerae bacterium]|nr:2-oxo acid dehydrogenase subunit E2 [Phycisphaerae bacterium]